MKHYMKLQNDPFTKIKNKTKTIEMRLNDEKRRKIKIHDLIEFTNIKTGEKLFTKVINLHYYNDFDELYIFHPFVSFQVYFSIAVYVCKVKKMYKNGISLPFLPFFGKTRYLFFYGFCKISSCILFFSVL